MIDIQILKQEEQEWYHIYNNNYRVTVIDDWKNVSTDVPVVCTGNLLYDNVQHWLTKHQPAVYFARGYVGNHLYKHKKFWRYSINGWANTRLSNIPYSRWNVLGLERHPWKVKDVKKVLIAPSKMTARIWTPELDTLWPESMLDKFPGAEVRIRRKEHRPWLRWSTLWDDLDWADLVVSQSSAITAEAFWYGKKVISLEPCPTWAAKKFTLEDWQDPKEPELRDQWHEHLAWCQYTVDEIESGSVLDLLQLYFGNLTNYKSKQKYNLIRN